MSNLQLISPDEEKQFREQGYLLLRTALPATEIEPLLSEVKRLVKNANDVGGTIHEELYKAGSYKLSRILRLSRMFNDLIDHPAYFGRLLSLMGTHIQLMSTEVFVRGAAHETIAGFHTDLGPGMQRLLPTDAGPFLQVKVQLFLTDLSEPNCSNFALIPGSHVQPVSDSNPLCMVETLNSQIGAEGDLPPGAKQILCRPGDVLFFPHSLWHAVAPNRSERTRFSIALRYGQLALRPLERFDDVLTATDQSLTVRQRRLLGDFGEVNPSPYRPRHQEQIIHGNQVHDGNMDESGNRTVATETALRRHDGVDP